MHAQFLNRVDDLHRLATHWLSDRPELLVVTGRRRVGKSRLLEEFFRDKPSIRIVGTVAKATIQLSDASREIYRVTKDPIVQHQDFTSWDALLAYIGEYTRERRVGFITDEFAYYCDGSPELPSVLQRWWDRVGQHTQAMILLAGSHVAFMENLVLGGQALYGRRTGELRLQPFDYLSAALFFPTYSPQDRLRTYAVFGGMPAHLAAYDDTESLYANIHRMILLEDAYLRREPQYLLAQERSVDRPASYFSILRVIAQGQTQPSDIATAAGFRSTADIAPFLERLREFRLVERVAPITAEGNSRLNRYALSDPFLTFWFRFVLPSEAALEQGAATWVLRHRILPNLDLVISQPNGPWERACRDYLWRAFRADLLGEIGFDRLGPWWEGRGASESAEIDIVGLDGRAIALVASCKWRNDFAKIGDLQELRQTAARIGAGDVTRYLLFSRSGFDAALIALADKERITLVTPEMMFAAHSAAP